jgi:hypothetical protein
MYNMIFLPVVFPGLVLSLVHTASMFIKATPPMKATITRGIHNFITEAISVNKNVTARFIND